MALGIITPDLDSIFKSVKSPLVVNDLPYITDDDKKAFNNIVLTVYESDVLSSIPHCACGEKRYGYNLGVICKTCNTPVEFLTESEIDLRTWIRVPEGFDGFILPSIWNRISRVLVSRGFNVLEWMVNPRLKIPKNLSKDAVDRITTLERLNWPRGLNEFIGNFDTFLEVLPSLVKKDVSGLIEYLKRFRHRLFPKYLALPTKAMLILENTQVGSFADNGLISEAMDAARTAVSIEQPRSRPLTYGQVETRVLNIMKHLTNYYTTILKDGLKGKNGWLRGQLFKSRSHFCYRGVIVSLHGAHDYEEIRYPWAQSLEINKIHIVSKLMHRGWSSLDAYSLVESSGNIYNELIAEILEELTAEAPRVEKVTSLNDGYLLQTGMFASEQRNPSLSRGSALLTRPAHAKTDPLDKTKAISVMSLRSLNADFDGDETNSGTMISPDIYETGKYLAPHYCIHDNSRIGRLSSIMKLPDVDVNVLANFINDSQPT